MPFRPRPRLPRSRHQALHLQSCDHEWYIWHPAPDDDVVISGFGEAAMLACEATALPARNEVLVLLDERRRVTAMLVDPPAEVGVFIGMYAPPGVEAPFCQTMSIVIQPSVRRGPPSDDDRCGYQALRRIHMAQGLLLLDVLITDGDTVRSLAIGCDPDPVWFDEFDPLSAGDGDTGTDAADPAA
jgi:hypothetical protein